MAQQNVLKKSKSNQKVLKSAGAMGAGTLCSRFLGLIREQVFAFFFGASAATDAFNIAFRIPNLLRDLFAEGAMSAALVPTFVRTRKKEGDRRAWQVAGTVFKILFLLVLLLSVLGIFFAPSLVELFASAYREVPGKFELTVHLTRIMFPFFPLVALAAAFMGILNACGVFFLPAFASALFNATVIIVGISGYFLADTFGYEPIEAMAVGVVLGGFVQACVQFPRLLKAGFSWVKRKKTDPAWNKDPALKSMLFLMGPAVLGLAATQINLLVNSILATSEGTGAVSWLNYAFRLMQFPIGVFGVSLAAATLPTVAGYWTDKNLKGLNQSLTHSLRQVFALNFPASVGLAVLGYPIIEMIFQYGHFTQADTNATAMALACYSIGLVAYSTVKVLVPACYGMGNTKIPVLSSVLSVVLNIALNLYFVRIFGYWGLALGTSLTAFFNASFLLIAIKKIIEKKGKSFHYMPLLKSFITHLVVSAVMGAACYFSYLYLSKELSQTHALARVFKVGVLVFEGVFVVFILAKIFKIKETNEVFQLFYQKLIR